MKKSKKEFDLNRVVMVPVELLEELLLRVTRIEEKLDSEKISKPEDRLLTTSEVMEFLKIGRTTFDKYKRENLLPVVKIGGKLYVTETALRKAVSDGVL